MIDNKGLTLIEVLLALFIFIMAVSIFAKSYYTINRLAIINITNREIGLIAKNKMEELKSGYIYIEDNKYYALNLGDFISFKEENYKINISIRPLDNYKDINCVSLEICNEEEGISYNLFRYINLSGMATDG